MDRGPNVDLNKYKLSRRGRKLQISDDQRTLLAMPKELPERTWAEILQKEENELIVLEIREELLDEMFKIVYEKYMNRQNSLFTVYCVSEAWLKLIDWFFYRHDPGDDPSSYPPCDIPKRVESWIPDQLPEPSPKDSWGQHNLHVVEEIREEPLQKWPSNSSLDTPVIDPIPSDYWFPGKVHLVPESEETLMTDSYDLRHRYSKKRFDPLDYTEGVCKIPSDSSETPLSTDLAADSELLQKVTDYCTGEMSVKESAMSALKTTTPVSSLQDAGDFTRVRKKKNSVSHKIVSGPSMIARSRMVLAPLRVPNESRSRISNISDCRLRSLRLDTQYEISSEIMETPPGLTIKRKN